MCAGSECRGSDSDRGGCVRTRTSSEDEFAEDELSLAGDLAHRAVGPTPPPANTLPSRLRSKNSSLAGSTGNDLCRDLDSSDADDRFKTSETESFLALRMANARNMSLPPGRRQHAATARRPKSLDRRRHRNSPRGRSKQATTSPPPPPGLEPAAFHVGLLPPESSSRLPANSSPAYHLPYNTLYIRNNPYETVLSRPPEMSSFRPPLPPQNPPKNSSSQDSFNSDSGFSNHTTSGGRATSSGGGATNSTRGRHHGHEHFEQRPPLPPLLS